MPGFPGERGRVPEPQRGEPTPRDHFLGQVLERLSEFPDGKEYIGEGLEKTILVPRVLLDREVIMLPKLFQRDGESYKPSIIFVVHPSVMLYEIPKHIEITTPWEKSDPWEEPKSEPLATDSKARIRNLELFVRSDTARRFRLPPLDIINKDNPVFFDENAPEGSSWSGKIPVGLSNDGQMEHTILVLLKPFEVLFVPLKLPANWRELFGPDGKLLPENTPTATQEAFQEYVESTGRIVGSAVSTGQRATFDFLNRSMFLPPKKPEIPPALATVPQKQEKPKPTVRRTNRKWQNQIDRKPQKPRNKAGNRHYQAERVLKLLNEIFPGGGSVSITEETGARQRSDRPQSSRERKQRQEANKKKKRK